MSPPFKQRVTGTLYLVLLSFVSVSSACADVIYDRSGGTLKGLVVEEHRDRIVLSTEGGEQTVLRSQIEEVFYAEPERNYLYLGMQALEAGDFAMARGFFGKALQINPDLLEAADALERAADLEKKRAVWDEKDPPEVALERQWGMMLSSGKERAVVSELRPGSAAERAGLLAGDLLVAAWNSSLSFLSPAEVAAELVGPAASRIKLTFQRRVRLPSGGSWEIKLSMERLGLTVAAPASPPLLPGDRIVFINGKSTRYLPLGTARRMMQESRKTGVELLVDRDVRVTRE